MHPVVRGTVPKVERNPVDTNPEQATRRSIRRPERSTPATVRSKPPIINRAHAHNEEEFHVCR